MEVATPKPTVTHDFVVGDVNLSFSLTRGFRKTLSINILKNGNLAVKSPIFISRQEIEKFITKHVHWILQKREYIKQQKTEENYNYADGAVFSYIGKPCTLQTRQGLLDEVVVGESEIFIYSTKPKNYNHNNSLFKRWRLAQANSLFRERLDHCLKNFPALKVPDLTIKNMKSRWGSYSSKHKITLNLKLLHASMQCIDYVIIHELCHYYYMNHGKEFKKLLTSKIPGWKEIKKELNNKNFL